MSRNLYCLTRVCVFSRKEIEAQRPTLYNYSNNCFKFVDSHQFFRRVYQEKMGIEFQQKSSYFFVVQYFAFLNAMKCLEKQQTEKQCVTSKGKRRFIKTPYSFLSCSIFASEKGNAQKISEKPFTVRFLLTCS